MRILTIHNAKELCCVCLNKIFINATNSFTMSSDNKQNIPCQKEAQTMLEKYIKLHIMREIEEDVNYPKNVCAECFYILKNFEGLHKKAVDSAEKLFCLFNSQTNIQKEEDMLVEDNFYENVESVPILLKSEDVFREVDSQACSQLNTELDDTLSNESNSNTAESECNSPNNNLNESINNTQLDPLDDQWDQTKATHGLTEVNNKQAIKSHVAKHSGKGNIESVIDKSGNILKIQVMEPIRLIKNKYVKVQLPQTEREVSKKQYSCDICSKSFRSYTYFIRHKYNEHSSNNCKTELECAECNQKFKTTILLEIHHKSVHMPVEEETQPLCHYCGFVAHSKASLRSHLANRHEQPVYFKCDQCPKSFKHKRSLEEHQKIHQNLKPFLCDQCNMAFTYKNSLVRHSYTHLAYEDRMKCDYAECKVRFIQECDKKEHIRLVHWKVKNKECDICGNVFGTNYQLKHHRYIHTGEKPFKCQECDQCFRHTKSLHVHRKTHHSKNTE